MKFRLTQKQTKILMIILVLSLVLNAVLWVGAMRGVVCFEEPLKYGAEKLSKSADSSIICRCDFTSGKYAPFYFSEEGLVIEK